MYHIGVIMPSDPQQHIMQYKNRAAWNQVRWVIQIIQAIPNNTLCNRRIRAGQEKTRDKIF